MTVCVGYRASGLSNVTQCYYYCRRLTVISYRLSLPIEVPGVLGVTLIEAHAIIGTRGGVGEGACHQRDTGVVAHHLRTATVAEKERVIIIIRDSLSVM